MSFSEEMKKYVDKGIDVSKEALSKAGTAVQKFGDQSVIRLEKAQLEKQFKDDSLKLGNMIYKNFAIDGKESIDVTDQEFVSIIAEMKQVKDEIQTREKLLKDKK